MAGTEHAHYLALLDVTEALASHSDLAGSIRQLARCLPAVVAVDFLALSLYDAERRVMRLHTMQANVSADIVGGGEASLADSPDGLVWETQQPLLAQDLAMESRWPKVVGLMKEDGIQSCCCVPLTTVSRRLGVLTCCSLRKEAYGPADLTLLQQIGRQVAVAVDNVLHREEAAAHKADVESQRDRFRLLLRMTNAMVSNVDLRALLRSVSASLKEIVPQEYISLILCDNASNMVRLVALDFPDNEGVLTEGGTGSVADSPAAIALETKHPVILNSRAQLSTFSHRVSRLLVSKGFQSLCALPLVSRDRAVGCLNLASRREQAFPEADIEFLKEVAGQITLAVNNAVAYEEITQLKDKLAEETLYLQEELHAEHGFADIIGESGALKQVLKQVEVVAPTDSTVLILGETGTGKELIARAIHRLSGRSARTFVKINCAAIPSGLLESELFGHERGAFTGAISQKVGRFELADKGTIFLDEVGEIPPELQSKLLRVLQEQEFERLGSAKTIRVNTRLIAATNRNLKRLVEENGFRSDLYYRLNVFPITMPPLRERREDIPVLVRYFTQRHAMRMNKNIQSVSAKVLNALSRYAWPGNIRELENLVERSVILTRGRELEMPLAELALDDRPQATGATTLLDAERTQILQTLRDVKWVIGGPAGAAARLGLKRTTLASKMKKLGISRPYQ